MAKITTIREIKTTIRGWPEIPPGLYARFAADPGRIVSGNARAADYPRHFWYN